MHKTQVIDLLLLFQFDHAPWRLASASVDHNNRELLADDLGDFSRKITTTMTDVR